MNSALEIRISPSIPRHTQWEPQKEKKGRQVFEGVMVKSFPSLLNNVDPRISMNSKSDQLKEIHTRHIRVKLSTDRILKEAE